MRRQRIATLTFCFLLALGATSASWAQNLPQFCSYGYFRANVSFVDNYAFGEGDGDEQQITQRLRQYFEYTANENLSAQVAYEIDSGWGWEGESGFGNDEAGQIEIKRAQLDFNWPNTDVSFNVGLTGWVAPGGPFGTPVLAGDMPGAFVNVPVNDMMGLTAGYIRASDQKRIYDDDKADGDELDAALLSLPLTMEGYNMNPYLIYSWIGENSEPNSYMDINDFQSWGMGVGTLATQLGKDDPASPWNMHSDEANAWWVGLPFGVDMFDPLSIKGQVLYGRVDADHEAMEREGYYMDLGIDYAMDMVTPSVFGIYSSGEDDDISDGSETFPTLYSDGYLYPPSGVAMGFNSHFGFRDGDYSLAQYIPHGIWTLGFALKDISFVDKLSHTVACAYSQGTHDSEVFEKMSDAELDVFKGQRFQELTDEDSSLEVTLHSNYQIYENLKAVLELSYASLDMDEDVWRSDDYRDEDAIVSTFGLSYSF
ncbi:MAG: outer membrane homotrimeric porin [Desulfovermiculus sp.]